MPLSEFEHALLGSIAYSEAFEPEKWSGTDEQSFQDYLSYQLDTLGEGSDLYSPPSEWITQDEWHAVLRAASESEGLAGYEVGEVATNPVDGSEMIYLVNRSTGEGCFVFEGTSTGDGWREDGLILAAGDTMSQAYAATWASGIMDREEADGHSYTYTCDGHSKGGSQAAALARRDARINHAYSYDGPGDDARNAGSDPRISHIENENDVISALLFLMGEETLLRSSSPDPGHASSSLGAHSYSNLFNFEYDEDGTLVCTGLGEDVTDGGGAWYRGLIRTVSKTLALDEPLGRSAVALEMGLVLQVALSDRLSIPAKVTGCLGILVASPALTGKLLVGLAAGVAAYGISQVAGLLGALLTDAFRVVAEAFVVMSNALAYVGERLGAAIEIAAGSIAGFVKGSWDGVRGWVSSAIEQGKAFLGSAGDLIGGVMGSVRGLLPAPTSTIYDFSSGRLEQLRSAYDSHLAIALLDPFRWSANYGGEPFMARLALSGTQEAIRSAYAGEELLAEGIMECAEDAFRRAGEQDARYAGGLRAVASGVDAAVALLA